MRPRLPILFMATALAGAIACTLNPQPLPPSDESPNGGTGASSSGSGGVPSEGGDAGPADGATRVDGAAPDAGDAGVDAGDAGVDAGDAGDGG